MTGKARKEGDIYGLVEKWNRNMPGDKSPGMFYKDRESINWAKNILRSSGVYSITLNAGMHFLISSSSDSSSISFFSANLPCLYDSFSIICSPFGANKLDKYRKS